MPRIDTDVKLDFKDVLVRPKRSTIRSRADVDLSRTFEFRNSGKSYEGIPIMASNMDTTGTFEMAKVLSKGLGPVCYIDECNTGLNGTDSFIEKKDSSVIVQMDNSLHGLFTVIHKHYSVDAWKEFAAQNSAALKNISVSSGMRAGDLEKLKQILAAIPEIEYICLDVANGYSEHFVEFVKQVRAEFPKHTIMAGNVVTGEMVEELILAGADIIKVGIGPGSVCTTRKKTGVGYPQLSAVLECADAAHGLGGHIISDGGCTNPGDVSKAFGAGADFVMLGGMFAGHDESGGETIEKHGKKFKQFYGMASKTAQCKHEGEIVEYRASEGKTVEIEYRGPVEKTVLDVLGGVRSTCTYVGASKLKELSRRTTFIRVTQQLNEIFTPFNKAD